MAEVITTTGGREVHVEQRSPHHEAFLSYQTLREWNRFALRANTTFHGSGGVTVPGRTYVDFWTEVDAKAYVDYCADHYYTAENKVLTF